MFKRSKFSTSCINLKINFQEEFLLNDQNGYLTDDSMADENTNPFQRNLLYSTYPPIGNLKKRDPPLSPQIVESDYNSDHSEYSDVSTGQVTSTPKMKRKFGSMRYTVFKLGFLAFFINA